MNSLANNIPFNKEFLPAWSEVIKNIPLSRITTKRQHQIAVKVMEYLIDIVNDNPKHQLNGLLEILEIMVEDYDRIHNQIPTISAAERLKNLMAEHNLKQSDLPEIGSQGVISEIISGKRRINRRQSAFMAKRFNLPENLFLD